MKKSIYIILFLILYLIVAFSSFFHAIEFFSLANQSWMAIILALAFEIGQAAVLFSILTDPHQRKKFIPWLLMGILTLIQIIGNVFSSYKYILGNSSDNLRFFKEPIFIWTDLPDDQTTVIITYITSAILPICALLLTSMVASFIHKDDELVEYIDEEDEHFEEEEQEKKYVPSDEEKEEIVNIPTTEDYEDYKEEEEHRHEEESKKENPSDDENASKVIYKEPDEEGEPEKEEYVSPITKEIVGTDPDGGVIGDEGVIVTEEKSEPIIEEIQDLPAPPKMKDSHFLNLKGN